MPKVGKPSLFSHHRCIVAVSVVWAAVWSLIVVAILAFPYALDNFNLNAFAASFTGYSVFTALIALGFLTVATLINAGVKDRRVTSKNSKPVPQVSDDLFKKSN